MTHLTFTNRRLEKIIVKTVGTASLYTTDSGGFGVPEYVASIIKAGDELYLELYKFNDIGGLMKPDGEYLFHRSDDYFTERYAEYFKDQKAKREKMYQDNFVHWTYRTAQLPDRYRNRLNRFLAEGEDFRKEPMGWGYELIVCELAVLYEKSAGAESDEIGHFARKYGTSGNQHDVAKAWVKNLDAKI